MNYSLKSLLSLFSIIICFHAVEIRERVGLNVADIFSKQKIHF